jgi:hypothetical protein
MVATPQFKFWVAEEVRRLDGHKNAETIVDEMMQQSNDFIVEVKDSSGKWVKIDPIDLS